MIFEILFEKLKNYHPLINSKIGIIAYSGGIDSSFLLLFYLYLYKKYSIPKPILFHLEHSIRDNSIQEKEILDYTKNFPFQTIFKKKNIKFLSKKIKKSIEETGRIFRYHELNKIAKKKDAYITIAHHSDDYFESILIHLIRGGGKKSLETMPIYGDNIFRPLLKISKSEIIEYIKDSDIKIFEDESNDDENYLRNRIRKNMVPFFQKEKLNTKKLFSNFHEENSNFIEKKTIHSFLKISKLTLVGIEIFYLKEILDIHLKILNLHPITKKVLEDLFEKLKSNSLLYMENSETFFWKSNQSDLFILPKKSKLFQEPKMKKDELIWNQNSFLISNEDELINKTEGLKIFHNKIHKEVSEIFRVQQIPTPIRKNIPIIKNNSSIKILFSMFDKEIKDVHGEI